MLHFAMRRRGAALLAATLASGVLAATTVAAPAQAATLDTSGIILGIAGNVGAAESKTGQNMALHRYGKFDDKQVPVAEMITVRSRSSWNTTANLSSGSQGYKDIVRWADTLKARGGKILVAFHHEPESTQSSSYGNAAAYQKAYRKVVTIFRSRNANNVVFTWQMTAWSFSAKSSDSRAAIKWYPGDGYVDVVGADPYNWYDCGHGKGKWNSLQQLATPVLDFAKAHGKQMALPEFASDKDARRATWLTDATKWLAANDKYVAAVFYFNQAPTYSTGQGCQWELSSTAEYNALRSMATHATFRS